MQSAGQLSGQLIPNLNGFLRQKKKGQKEKTGFKNPLCESGDHKFDFGEGEGGQYGVNLKMDA